MKKLFIKIGVYTVLILICLEVFVRVFHLTKDYPVRIIDDRGVERWMPNQDGFSVTGNRRQNFSEYSINNNGYNSYHNYEPSKNKVEIALIGDSFIEGFHQHYYNSIGKKVEDQLENIEVYEFGYAGYDLADQLHLIYQYQSFFDLIDYAVIGLDFDTDLTRSEYYVMQDRMILESPKYQAMRKIKLLVYFQNIGAFDAPRELVKRLFSREESATNTLNEHDKKVRQKKLHETYFKNFKSLVNAYGFDKTRFVFLLDADKAPEFFLSYLKENNYNYIDFSQELKKSDIPTSLIYDMHWNNHGREIIANLISNYYRKKLP
ncbi:hypothetical protein [Mariniflexile sp.]|uniref:hypothetical protein n=1 Tax=Mariniflexile sp. TaxID=1979402 RepID=UPI003569A56E